MATFIYEPTGSLFFHTVKDTFVYQASGCLCFLGRATTTAVKLLKTTYKPGDTVYNKLKATKGILEPVVIKRIEFNQRYGSKNGCYHTVLYVDTFNSLWNDYLLVGQNDAVALAQAYYTRVLAVLHEEEQADLPASCRS